MFYVDTVGDAATVTAAVFAMTSSGSLLENQMMASVKSVINFVLIGSPGTPGYTGQFQVQIRGGITNGAVAVSWKVNAVQVDARGNVRMGSTNNLASVFTP